MAIQTRSETNGLKFHISVHDAFDHALKDPTVWKISFYVGGERVRLVSDGSGSWVHSSVKNEVDNLLLALASQEEP